MKKMNMFQLLTYSFSSLLNINAPYKLFFTSQIRPVLPPPEASPEEEDDVDIDEEDEHVLVINHRENETASPEEDEDSGREDSA